MVPRFRSCTFILVCMVASPRAQDWPMWQGPTANFIADPAETGISANPSTMKLAWTSQDNTIPPGRSQAVRYGCNEGKLPGGGMATPLVYRNRVYLFYVYPTGSEIDQKSYDDAKARCTKGITDEGAFRRLWLTHAENVVICIDAADGRTIWKKNVVTGGYPRDWSKPREANNTPVIADGKLVFFGSDGNLWAVDTETGATVWGPKKPDCLNGYTSFQGTPALVHADGVVAFGGCIRNYRFNYVAGVDINTGETRWTVEDMLGNQASPTVWEHDGVKYFICSAGVGAYSAERPGRVSCIRAVDGELMWIDSTVAGNISGVTVNGDYLVCNAGGGIKKWQAPVQAGGYILSTVGMEQLWVLPEKYSSNNGSDPAIIWNDHAYIRRAVKAEGVIAASSLIVVDMGSGQVVGEWAPGNEISTEGYHMIVDGLLFEQVDGNHSDRENHLWVLNADPTDFRYLGTFKPTTPHTTAYEIAMIFPICRGKMYARGNHTGRMYAYDMRGSGVATRVTDARARALPRSGGHGPSLTVDMRGRALSVSSGARGVYCRIDAATGRVRRTARW